MKRQAKRGPSINMAEAMIVSEIKKLCNLRVKKASLHEIPSEVEELMNETKLFVDLLRDKKLEEGSCRLNYLISDILEMARDARCKIYDITGELKQTNKRLRELGDPRFDGGGEGEEDEDMVGFEEDVKLLLHTIDTYEEDYYNLFLSNSEEDLFDEEYLKAVFHRQDDLFLEEEYYEEEEKEEEEKEEEEELFFYSAEEEEEFFFYSAEEKEEEEELFFYSAEEKEEEEELFFYREEEEEDLFFNRDEEEEEANLFFNREEEEEEYSKEEEECVKEEEDSDVASIQGVAIDSYVASIQGIAGSGKTTLARHLYNHIDIVKKFHHRVWVTCTDILSLKELLIKLIRQLPGGRAMVAAAEKMDRADIQSCVVQLLGVKRFFLVLDDVRRIHEPLREFGQYLCRHGHVEGRIVLLFTCRAMTSSLGANTHHMKPLDVDKSWQLLLKTVLLLISNDKLPKKVERKGKAMLMKHTGGVPLAIKEVAMEWVEKRRLGIEWEDVIESQDLELRETLAKLDSSVYHNLDPATKSCFQHLSFFKLGTTIRMQRFMDTLVGSGLLGMSRSKYCYSTCFSKLVEEQIIGTEKYLVGVADSKEVRISPIFYKLSTKKVEKGKDGASHRVICCSRERFSCSTDRNEKIYCLSFHGGGLFDASPSYWKSFEQLRVLDFEDFGLKFLPETVGELIELRYLGLRNNYILELPRSLGYLKKLEVLDIAQNFMVEVPDIIWEMDALVDLYMSDIFCTKPLKVEGLKNLETLSYISVDNWACEESDLRMMTRLGKLGIEVLDGKSDLSKLFSSLSVLKLLYHLTLRGFRFQSMSSLEGLGVLHNIQKLKLDGLITKLPCPEDFPPNLRKLTLVNSYLDDDPMPVLEKLPHLKFLKLQNAYSGQQMVISGTGFPTLVRMCIKELWHLRNIQVGWKPLRSLWELEITSCPYLESLPKEMFSRLLVSKACKLTKNLETKVRKSGLASILQP